MFEWLHSFLFSAKKEELSLEHAEARWEETKQDDEDLREAHRKLAYADEGKAELEARLTGIRRIREIQRLREGQ